MALATSSKTDSKTNLVGKKFSVDFPLRLFWVVTGHPITEVPEKQRAEALNDCIEIYLKALLEELKTQTDAKTAYQIVAEVKNGETNFESHKILYKAHQLVIDDLALKE